MSTDPSFDSSISSSQGEGFNDTFEDTNFGVFGFLTLFITAMLYSFVELLLDGVHKLRAQLKLKAKRFASKFPGNSIKA